MTERRVQNKDILVSLVADTRTDEAGRTEEHHSHALKRVRVAVVLLTSITGLLGYIQRVNLSSAITGVGSISEEYSWTYSQRGHVLSSFFWGYASMQIASGFLVTRYGSRKMLAISMIGSSVFSAAFPLTCRTGSIVVPCVCRAMMGVFQGPMYSAYAVIVGKWLTKQQRSWGYAVIDGGSYVGTTLSLVICPYLMNRLHWSWLFYGPSIITVIFIIPFL